MQKKLILGSSSPSRRAIMDQIGVTYSIAHPNIDETALPGESALDLTQRLAKEKALAVQTPGALIIGSDQVASIDGDILGKPGDEESAFNYLRKQRGRETIFNSGVCLLNGDTGETHIKVDQTRVKFRDLSDDEIWRYIKKEQPLHCAGAFKCESLGMLLVEYVHCDDIHALIGLSIITLRELLQKEGVNLL